MKIRFLIGFLVVFLMNGWVSAQIADTYYPEKTQILYELNNARENPKFYGDAHGIDLSNYRPAPEMYFDLDLALKAQEYSEVLYNNVELVHSTMPYRESILWNYDACNSVSQFIIDAGVPNFSHRNHLLSQNETKIGIGIYKGRVGYWDRVYVVILTE